MNSLPEAAFRAERSPVARSTIGLIANVQTDVRSVRENVADDRALARVVVRLEPERSRRVGEGDSR